MTAAEAAKELGVGVARVYQLLKSRTLKGRPMGGKSKAGMWLIYKRSVEKAKDRPVKVGFPAGRARKAKRDPLTEIFDEKWREPFMRVAYAHQDATSGLTWKAMRLRAQGKSFAEIGRHLGMTRQAAQQRVADGTERLKVITETRTK